MIRSPDQSGRRAGDRPEVRSVVARISIAFGVLVLSGLAALVPSTAEAACGAVPDGGRLVRYVGRHAHTILLGRFVERDSAGAYRFEVLAAYRGDSTAAIPAAAFEDVGGCSIQKLPLRPGQRFMFVAGDSDREAPKQVIFPRVAERGFVINLYGESRSLNGLLGLLGVLPDTSTAALQQPPGVPPGITPAVTLAAAISAFAWVFFHPFGKRRDVTFTDAEGGREDRG
jgi:hypothetical protein